MCGLAGVASTERRKYEESRKSAFRQMLEAASWRGKDATGVACVKISHPKKPAIVFKKAVKASDFIDLDHYRRVERNFDEYGFVIGHARSSTSDGWNLEDANAHPFQFGPITLVHNGTIRNHRMIDSEIDHPVDSAHVAAALVKQEPVKLLERLNGPFALVWHDARDGSLNFAKNPEKPLFWCYVEKENTMFWGSELEAMYAVLARHNIEIDGLFRHCTSYTHFKFSDMDNLRNFTRVPFGKPPSATGTHLHRPGAAWKEETRRLAGPVSDFATTSTRHTIPQAGSDSTPTPEKSLKEAKPNTTPGLQTDTEPTGAEGTCEGVIVLRADQSVRPTNRRKLRNVQERLLQFGRKIDAPICFQPEYWFTYKNQKPERGVIIGHDKVKQQKFQVGHVPQEVWGKALKYGKIYGRIVNIKRDRTEKNGHIIICDYAPDLMERYVFAPFAYTSPEVLDTGLPFPRSVEEIVHETVVAQAKYLGPGDVKLTEKEFNSLVKHGCAFCSKDITPDEHEEILWVGPHNQSPICMECSGSPTVRLQLGISDSEAIR